MSGASTLKLAIGIGCCGSVVLAATISVDITATNYDPALIAVDVGDTVTWTNTDTLDHTSTALDTTWDSGVIEPDSSWSVVFDALDTGIHQYEDDEDPTELRGSLIVGGTGVKVQVAPDQTTWAGTGTVDWEAAVFNFTGSTVVGDMWFEFCSSTVNCAAIPDSALNVGNPILDQSVAAGGRRDVSIEWTPGVLDSVTYQLRTYIGDYPNSKQHMQSWILTVE